MDTTAWYYRKHKRAALRDAHIYAHGIYCESNNKISMHLEE